jgi:hypothetical protein
MGGFAGFGKDSLRKPVSGVKRGGENQFCQLRGGEKNPAILRSVVAAVASNNISKK